MRNSYIKKFSQSQVHRINLNVWMQFNLFLIMITVWISALLFGLYILSFYLGNAVAGKSIEWNQKLPGLFNASSHVSTVGISLHFAAGAIILMLGSIQLLPNIRARFPWLHRILGRVYIVAALITGIGGLIFIIANGTVGGLVMDIGFAGYGILMIISAIQTYRHARQHEWVVHRRWAIRLFALALGSWLYRMDYGFWFFFTDGLGHTKDFHGYFDKFMSFFFYLPNLYVAELIVQYKAQSLNSTWQFICGNLLACASVFVMVGTYTFLEKMWWAEIALFLS